MKILLWEKNKGFTMVEIIIVMALVGIGMTFATKLISYYQNKKLILEAQEIMNQLEYAKERSITQDERSKWGVHFDNISASDIFFALFRGSEYQSSASFGRTNLDKSLRFLIPTSTQALDIVFNTLSGKPTSSEKVIIENAFNGKIIEINVSSTGIISISAVQ